MQGGRVVEVGTVYDVFSAPQAEITRTFIESVQRDRPDERALQRLRTAHPGTLVSFTVRHDGGEDRLLSRLVREHDVEFSIVYGGISDIQDRPFGNLTVELLGEPAAVRAVVAGLEAATDVRVLDEV
jgi:D-methionine transport system ATP-binding protein